MENNIENVNENPTTDVSTVDLIMEAKKTNETLLAELKASKKREAEMAKALLNNESIQDSKPVNTKSAAELAAEFFDAAKHDDMRRGFEIALEYREARKREAGIDPFVMNNPQNPPTSADYMDADRQAEQFQEWVDNSENLSDFKLEYNRNVTDKK